MAHIANTRSSFNALLGAALLVMALSMAACADSLATTPEPMDTTLNLDTLAAETELGTLQAERVDASYVGLIDEGQAIGIARLADIGAAAGQEQQLVVYLYNRGDLAVLIGELDAAGTGTFESGELSDFDATVELVMEDEAVSGTATFPGAQPAPFTVPAASGDGGVYWAQGTAEDPQVSGDWVVLPEGRQWGCVCFPPYRGPCCEMRTN